MEGIIVRANAAPLAGRTVRVAEVHDLIAMKVPADRPQDDYDTSEILCVQTIDDDRVEQRVDTAQFARYEGIRDRKRRR